MDKKIKMCDRCLKEITGPPYFKFTVSWHHEGNLDICGKCEKSFRNWLHEPQPGIYTAL